MQSTHYNSSAFALKLITSLALLQVGCAELSDEQESDLESRALSESSSIAGSQSAIHNGTLIESAAETEGIVLIRHQDQQGLAFCTGTLLRNDLVLTALRCASVSGYGAPPIDTNYSNYTLTMGGQTAQVVNAIGHPSADAALLQVNTFFTMNGSKFDYHRSVFGGSAASIPSSMPCYGYGDNAVGGGSGSLRTAVLPVALSNSSSILVSLTSSYQIFMPGDAGGTCFRDGEITGVVTAGPDIDFDGIPEYTHLTSPLVYRPWLLNQSVLHADASVHVSTSGNTSGAFSEFSSPHADGNPTMLIQVTPNLLAGANNNAFVGVKYSTGSQRWQIGNLSGNAMAVSSAYNVSVGGNSFRHTSSSGNTQGNRTALDHASINNKPSALLFVTQDMSGTLNPRAVAVAYNASTGRWSIFNEDGSPMPADAAFNVRVGTSADAAFVHTTNLFNVLFNWTYLDHPLLNNQPDAQFFITHNGTAGPAVSHPLAASYDAATGKWTVVTQNLGSMPWAASFNILIRP